MYVVLGKETWTSGILNKNSANRAKPAAPKSASNYRILQKPMTSASVAISVDFKGLLKK